MAPTTRPGCYTNHPNEVPTQITTPTSDQVIQMLQTSWNVLTDVGARVLAAKFLLETNGGRNCFDWNLGNVKATLNQSHMYLRDNLECVASTSVERIIANSNGNAAALTQEQQQSTRWQGRCSGGNVGVLFQPPSPECRFRAFDSLSDGGAQWVALQQRIAANHTTYVDALNSGNCAVVAHLLRVANYYNAAESSYAAGLQRYLNTMPIDLGEVDNW